MYIHRKNHLVEIRVATGQEEVKFFSGQEKVRKNQRWSGKLEKITKSQENVRKNKIFF